MIVHYFDKNTNRYVFQKTTYIGFLIDMYIFRKYDYKRTLISTD